MGGRICKAALSTRWHAQRAEGAKCPFRLLLAFLGRPLLKHLFSRPRLGTTKSEPAFSSATGQCCPRHVQTFGPPLFQSWNLELSPCCDRGSCVTGTSINSVPPFVSQHCQKKRTMPACSRASYANHNVVLLHEQTVSVRNAKDFCRLLVTLATDLQASLNYLQLPTKKSAGCRQCLCTHHFRSLLCTRVCGLCPLPWPPATFVPYKG